jgi:hypothetical protein
MIDGTGDAMHVVAVTYAGAYLEIRSPGAAIAATKYVQNVTHLAAQNLSEAT